MAKKELVDFLIQAKKLKLDIEKIGRLLIDAGWSIEDVGEAIESTKPFKAPKAPLKAPKFSGKS